MIWHRDSAAACLLWQDDSAETCLLWHVRFAWMAVRLFVRLHDSPMDIRQSDEMTGGSDLCVYCLQSENGHISGLWCWRSWLCCLSRRFRFMQRREQRQVPPRHRIMPRRRPGRLPMRRKISSRRRRTIISNLCLWILRCGRTTFLTSQRLVSTILYSRITAR